MLDDPYQLAHKDAEASSHSNERKNMCAQFNRLIVPIGLAFGFGARKKGGAEAPPLWVDVIVTI